MRIHIKNAIQVYERTLLGKIIILTLLINSRWTLCLFILLGDMYIVLFTRMDNPKWGLCKYAQWLSNYQLIKLIAPIYLILFKQFFQHIVPIVAAFANVDFI
ncbi:unnamed protein product [Paramecium sonneborni]|uniref:Uncharacterized protein n=1 Tax=Paramecium sonneborni TaxID=65129 RepID=A0A8S1RLF2_9CILI|nr:unnamed protein product [Paramecium sonneborni]